MLLAGSKTTGFISCIGLCHLKLFVKRAAFMCLLRTSPTLRRSNYILYSLKRPTIMCFNPVLLIDVSDIKVTRQQRNTLYILNINAFCPHHHTLTNHPYVNLHTSDTNYNSNHYITYNTCKTTCDVSFFWCSDVVAPFYGILLWFWFMYVFLHLLLTSLFRLTSL